MRNIRLTTFLGALAIGCIGTTSAFAQDKDEDTPMSKEMSEVSSSLKKLRKLEKGDYASGAAAVREAHEALLRSMAYKAAQVEELADGKEKDIALADSRRLLGLSYAVLCELELAYLNEDDAKIEELAQKVKDSKKEGHKKYDK